MEAPRRDIAGIAYGLGAYLWWGLCPIYFKAVAHVPPAEVLAHRIVWSVVLLGALLALRGRTGEIWSAARQPRVLRSLLASTLLVTVNWFTFIWAVSNDRILAASFGYFMNPLVTVLLGVLVLGERLRRGQAVSLVLAVVGVALMGWRLGAVPMVSLALAFSFGLYGLIRKTAAVGATVGLTIECALLAPLALAALAFLDGDGALVFGHLDRRTDVLLALSGVVTALPLVWFAAGARRLRLATMGFLHYVTPSGQFLLAVLVYGEPFSGRELAPFLLIWAALALYSLDLARSQRRPPRDGLSGATGRSSPRG